MAKINIVMGSYKGAPALEAVKSSSAGWDVPLLVPPQPLIQHIQSLIPPEAAQTVRNFEQQIQHLVIARRDYVNDLKKSLSPLIKSEIDAWIQSHPEFLL